MGGDYYVFIDDENQLFGYFCFGKSAQIPTNDYIYSGRSIRYWIGYEANFMWERD